MMNDFCRISSYILDAEYIKERRITDASILSELSER